MLIAKPDIKSFEINDNSDFLLIGSDGIFEKASNEILWDTVWKTFSRLQCNDNMSFHTKLGNAADMILK